MTVQNTADFEFETGLEDFDMEDAVIPRLTIVHKEAEFKDSLSNEQFTSIKVIILGLVKQRVLWHQTVDDGDYPMCRSVDHDFGIPNISDEQPKDKRFPWEKSNFDPKDFPENENGNILLPCNGCALKEWGSHPDGKRPYCSEQFTLPVLYDPRDDNNWVPAIITFQKTGLKPLKSYLTSFARSRNAAYMAVTEITLDLLKRGQTDYSVPVFKRVGDTDEESWREYSVNYRAMRDFLVAEPGSREESEGGGSPAPAQEKPKAEAKPEPKKEDVVDAEVVEDPPVEEKAPEAQPPEPEAKAEDKSEAAPADDDDDLPF